MPEEEITQDSVVEDTPAPAKKAAKKKAAKKAAPKVTVSKSPPAEEAKDVVFRSRLEEPREFAIMKIRAVRNAKHPGMIEWHVPAELAERFARHPHVQRNRVIKVG